MYKTLTKALIFAAGAAIGSAVTWKLVKTKYEQMAQEEIESVREYYRKRESDIPDSGNTESVREYYDRKVKEAIDKAADNRVKADDEEYRQQLKDLGYNPEDESEPKEEIVEEVPYEDFDPEEDAICIIEPDEFSQFADYEYVYMTYFSRDNVLVADDTDEVIKDIDSVIGADSLDHFGEYEDDVVHVRNNALKTDYEIVRVDERYYDVLLNEQYKNEEK